MPAGHHSTYPAVVPPSQKRELSLADLACLMVLIAVPRFLGQHFHVWCQRTPMTFHGGIFDGLRRCACFLGGGHCNHCNHRVDCIWMWKKLGMLLTNIMVKKTLIVTIDQKSCKLLLICGCKRIYNSNFGWFCMYHFSFPELRLQTIARFLLCRSFSVWHLPKANFH